MTKRYASFAIAILLLACSVRADNDTATTAYLGVSSSPMSPALRAHVDLPDGIGLVVQYVDADGPTANRLKTNDILHKLGDQLLVSHQQLAVLVRTHQPGDEVVLSVIRGGKPKTVTVTLGKRDLSNTQPTAHPWPNINIESPGFKIFQFGDDFMIPHNFQELVEKRFKGLNQGDMTARNIAERIQQMFSNMNVPQVSILGQNVSSRTLVDGDVVITLTEQDNGKQLVIKKTDGTVVFEGPIDTDADRKKVPEEYRDKLKNLEASSPKVKQTQQKGISLRFETRGSET